ncbi:hypothetical protein [Mumia sp. Pv 4-285]|uniref:hypothetical protein n=1 Tax=Mumia qirimensis TaxID=3234852 RepID=UPI00351D62C9
MNPFGVVHAVAALDGAGRDPVEVDLEVHEHRVELGAEDVPRPLTVHEGQELVRVVVVAVPQSLALSRGRLAVHLVRPALPLLGVVVGEVRDDDVALAEDVGVVELLVQGRPCARQVVVARRRTDADAVVEAADLADGLPVVAALLDLAVAGVGHVAQRAAVVHRQVVADRVELDADLVRVDAAPAWARASAVLLAASGCCRRARRAEGERPGGGGADERLHQATPVHAVASGGLVEGSVTVESVAHVVLPSDRLG